MLNEFFFTKIEEEDIDNIMCVKLAAKSIKKSKNRNKLEKKSNKDEVKPLNLTKKHKNV